MKFKVGDRVVVIEAVNKVRSEYPYKPGVTFQIEKIDRGDIYGLGRTDWITYASHLEYEHIYNSRLYKALHEED